MTDEPTPSRDPVVDRVNELATTFLDTLSMLAVGVGVAWAGWIRLGPGFSIIVGACLLAAMSAVTQSRQHPRVAKVPPGAHPHRELLPGPEDPGNLHVKGR